MSSQAKSLRISNIPEQSSMMEHKALKMVAIGDNPEERRRRSKGG
jgi:hypothetical protein